jgi:hypothetical protein
VDGQASYLDELGEAAAEADDTSFGCRCDELLAHGIGMLGKMVTYSSRQLGLGASRCWIP